MREKTPKSPILVVATMMLLAMFIVLPPLLRTYMPKEDGVVVVKIVKHSLYCEKISIKEEKKITSRISYENDVAVKNVLTYLEYTPSKEEKDTIKDSNSSYSTIDEVNYLRSVVGIELKENASQTVVTLTQQNVVDNPMDVNLLNYLGETEVVSSFFEGNGFICSKIEN